MKKFLILGALAAGVYYWYNNTQKTTTTDTGTGDTGGNGGDIFSTYNNRVLRDSGGYYFLVDNGLLRTPMSGETLSAWQAANPATAEVLFVNQDIWAYYANNYPEKIGSSF